MIQGGNMNFEFNNNIPIYIQLVEQLKIYIISGKLEAGERLPSVRDLALQTKVNPNTMQKALAELEELGLVYTERTNGKFVTKDRELIEKFKKEYAKEIAENYFSCMQSIGFNDLDAVEFLEKFGGNK
jgi:DNA-binding transcriptional regulator YhcF (GntR family)